MESIQECEARFKQAERNTTLASLLYITRELGKLEGYKKALGVLDPRIDEARVNLLGVYERMVEEVELAEHMRQQDEELSRGLDYEY